jgi:hypothetical protein
MKYAVKMGSSAMICTYIPSLVKIDQPFQSWGGGNTQTAWRLHMPALHSRKVVMCCKCVAYYSLESFRMCYKTCLFAAGHG